MSFHNEKKQLIALQERIETQEISNQIEVAGRYFIANYYSGKSSRLLDFLDKDLKEEGLESKNGTLQSILLEKTEKKGNYYHLTFIVSMKTEDEDVRTERLALVFKKESSSIYGYLLTQKPKVSAFSS